MEWFKKVTSTIFPFFWEAKGSFDGPFRAWTSVSSHLTASSVVEAVEAASPLRSTRRPSAGADAGVGVVGASGPLSSFTLVCSTAIRLSFSSRSLRRFSSRWALACFSSAHCSLSSVSRRMLRSCVSTKMFWPTKNELVRLFLANGLHLNYMSFCFFFESVDSACRGHQRYWYRCPRRWSHLDLLAVALQFAVVFSQIGVAALVLVVAAARLLVGLVDLLFGDALGRWVMAAGRVVQLADVTLQVRLSVKKSMHDQWNASDPRLHFALNLELSRFSKQKNMRLLTCF